ncbi:hypothetical protein [Candidatus Uabimicrobium sp. HlEnr_7]|uniref:hypothetical protein n=1 Tax=Candidatus Uabimicrobium helgolandensis TaxID=3095367 RepID=UPI003556C5AB
MRNVVKTKRNDHHMRRTRFYIDSPNSVFYPDPSETIVMDDYASNTLLFRNVAHFINETGFFFTTKNNKYYLHLRMGNKHLLNKVAGPGKVKHTGDQTQV